MQTTETLREQAESLFSAIDAIPEPDRTELLLSSRGKAAGRIRTPNKSDASAANARAQNERVRAAGGLSPETRAKMAEAQARRRQREGAAGQGT
jgi:hypothetical protein